MASRKHRPGLGPGKRLWIENSSGSTGPIISGSSLMELQNSHHWFQHFWNQIKLFLKCPLFLHYSFNIYSQLAKPRTKTSLQLLWSEKRELHGPFCFWNGVPPNQCNGEIVQTTKGIETLSRQENKKGLSPFVICVNTSSYA